MGGGKVGYAHNTMRRSDDVIHTRMTTKLRIGRMDSPVRIEIIQSTKETLAGAPLEFTTEMNAATANMATKGKVEDGRVIMTTSQLGMEQTQTIDFPEGALMAWGQFRESLRRGFRPGTEYEMKVFAPELRIDGAVKAMTKVGEWEEFEHRGTKRRGQRVTVEMVTPMGTFETVSWVDKEGRPLKSKVPAPGLGDMVIVTTDETTALADFVPPEIFMSTVVKANRRIDPGKAQRVKYRIRTLRDDVDLGTLPETGMQAVSKNDDGTIDVVVTRQAHQISEPRAYARAKAQIAETNPQQLSKYLESNLMINTSDPDLIKLAKRAAEGEKNPYALADKLRRFVSSYVDSKNLDIGFATASEVARTREGDCSEHGVLLAALGRLNKLPSRVAVGVAYVPAFAGEDGAFGYHLWTQFFIDGRWVDVDAALNETECSPTRIAFATSSLQQTGLADLSLPLLPKIGAIAIDVLDVQESTSTGD